MAWRRCALCGAQTWGTAQRRYCGVRCRLVAHRDRLMRAAGRERRRVCAQCGAPLPAAPYRNRMYCSPLCKVHAFRARRRDAP